MNIMNNHYFITIDAETDVISEGIQVIPEIRDEIERKKDIRIPLIWHLSRPMRFAQVRPFPPCEVFEHTVKKKRYPLMTKGAQ